MPARSRWRAASAVDSAPARHSRTNGWRGPPISTRSRPLASSAPARSSVRRVTAVVGHEERAVTGQPLSPPLQVELWFDGSL